MTENCRCGAGLISGLAFCVTCGARRPELVGVGIAQNGGVAFGARPLPTAPRSGHGRPVAHPSLPPTPVARRHAQPYPVSQPHPAAPQPRPAVSWPAAPAAPVRSSVPWIVGGASIVVVAVVAALLLLTLRPATGSVPAAASQPATVVVPSTTTITAAPTSDVVSSTTTSSTGQLSDQVDTDRAAVEGLTGSWVPQLSSKRVGTVADGITYEAGDILAHYRGLAATYPDAKLLYSGDWPVFNGADYWVVVVAEPFSTPAAANAWCSSHGFARDECFAKQLSHSGGPAGTTVQR